MTALLSGEPHLSSWRRSDKLAKLEAVIVVVAAPFLFFPTLSLFVTFLALTAIAVVWLLPPLIARRPGLPESPFNVALIPWGMVLIVAILVSADPLQTLPKATGIILGLAVWRLLILFAHSRTDVRLGVIGYVAIGTGLAIIGAFGLNNAAKIPAIARFNPAHLLPILEQLGLSIHPNQLAGLICLCLPLLVSLLLSRQAASGHSAIKRVGLLLLTVIFGAILIITQSRGGWIGVAAGLVALLISWAILMPPSTSRRLARLAIFALAMIAAIVMIWVGPQRLQQVWLEPPSDTAIGTLTTLNYRKELWPWALSAAEDFAFTGTGLGTFREVAFRLYPVQLAPSADIGHAHNMFLQTALDVGVPGLIVYVSLLLLALGGAWTVAVRDATYRPVALGLLAGLVALHTYGLADALALGSKPSVLFWYALGLIAAMCLTSPRRLASQSSA